MFSFIKWFNSLIENAKRKKGLWFTLLTVISLLGIFASLYFVNFLVSDVAQKTYDNQKNQYVMVFKNKIFAQAEYTQAIASAVALNKDIGNDFFLDDANASRIIAQKSDQIAQKINASLGKKSLSISYQKVDKADKIVGIDITRNGAIFKSMVPMVNKDGAIISVVVSKDIDILVDSYKKERKEFAFFLNESSINKIDRDIKKKSYESFDDKFYVKKASYNGSFLKQLKSVDFSQKLEENGVVKDNVYFYVYQKVYDIDGDYVGIAVIAEEVKGDNSFVNLVKNLVNSVTMVALGLIVSMLLFLF